MSGIIPCYILLLSQVYHGQAHTHTLSPSPSPSPSSPHQLRVRACTSCHANSRQELLYSSFSSVATYTCGGVATHGGVASQQEKADTSTHHDDRAVVSKKNWVWSQVGVVSIFVGVAVGVLVLAVLVGQLVV